MIAPAVRYLFADSGVRGDEFCRRLVGLAPSFLEEGGYCQVMANWAHRRRASRGRSPLAGWFEGSGCDVLVWGAETQDASSYAITWIQQTEADYLPGCRELYDTWMSYYEREGIEAVTYGLIAMRRSPGHRNWVRFIKVPKGASAPSGEPHPAPLPAPGLPRVDRWRRAAARPALSPGRGRPARAALRPARRRPRRGGDAPAPGAATPHTTRWTSTPWWRRWSWATARSVACATCSTRCPGRWKWISTS